MLHACAARRRRSRLHCARPQRAGALLFASTGTRVVATRCFAERRIPVSNEDEAAAIGRVYARGGGARQPLLWHDLPPRSMAVCTIPLTGKGNRSRRRSAMSMGSGGNVEPASPGMALGNAAACANAAWPGQGVARQPETCSRKLGRAGAGTVVLPAVSLSRQGRAGRIARGANHCLCMCRAGRAALPAAGVEHAARRFSSSQAGGSNGRTCSEFCKAPGGVVRPASVQNGQCVAVRSAHCKRSSQTSRQQRKTARLKPQASSGSSSSTSSPNSASSHRQTASSWPRA